MNAMMGEVREDGYYWVRSLERPELGWEPAAAHQGTWRVLHVWEWQPHWSFMRLYEVGPVLVPPAV